VFNYSAEKDSQQVIRSFSWGAVGFGPV
jgi:hypothetical protein